MNDIKSFEIARETLKQLTTRKLLPTPLNYQAIYNEIAGIAQVQPFPADPADSADILAQIGRCLLYTS